MAIDRVLTLLDSSPSSDTGSLPGLPSVREAVMDSQSLSGSVLPLFTWEIFEESPKRSTTYNFDSKGTSFTIYFLLVRKSRMKQMTNKIKKLKPKRGARRTMRVIK